MDSIETLKDDLLKGGLAIFPPRQNRGWDGGVYTPFLHLHRAGDTNLFVLSVNLPFPFLPVVLQWTGMQVR